METIGTISRPDITAHAESVSAPDPRADADVFVPTAAAAVYNLIRLRTLLARLA